MFSLLATIIFSFYVHTESKATQTDQSNSHDHEKLLAQGKGSHVDHVTHSHVHY